MANKAGTIVAAFFAILAILLACVLCGSITYAGGCNIAGVTFNSTSARDSLPAMLGNAFWGWIVAPIGVLLIGLLCYAGYLVCVDANNKMNGRAGSDKGIAREDQ